ncbi:MAG: bifunctional aspartate kinase/homoserine dehydrogenase I [Treponema sp.]|nr:bifunctional aspartate kinase/homoserine dehydrogenase I [Treponema sp.]
MLVLKFGGTSMGSAKALESVIEIIKEPERRKEIAAVVVSAFSGVTDKLIEISRSAAGAGSAAAESYLETAKEIQKRHLEIAGHFLSGNELKKAEEFFNGQFSELQKVLEGVSILGELSPRSLDLIMGFGERFSAGFLASILCARGIDAVFVDARPLIKTNASFGKALVQEEKSFSLIRPWFDSLKQLPILTGFIASTDDGISTTIGRGGSDLSAALFGAALGVKEVEIWTDVDGILTADPRQVKNAFPIDSISYEEAMELSHFGAKVIYPPTIRPALERGIPIRIKNTFNSGAKGTLIVKDSESGPYAIRGISSMSPVALIRVQGPAMVGVAGFSSRLFGALARRKISVILISQSSSEYSICLAVLPADVSAAEEAIREEFSREIDGGVIDQPVSEGNLSIIAVVGSGMKNTSGISGKVFHALGKNGVNVIAIVQGSSEINISAVISKQDEAKALNAIHEAFFLAGLRSVNLFLIGMGNIGGTLLEQIAAQREILAENHKIRINLAGAAELGRMIFDPAGIDPGTVRSLLRGDGMPKGGEEYSLPLFIEKMKGLNLPNSAFCDCTASDEIAMSYAKILKTAIAVITPNKRANTSSFEYYKKLRNYSLERGIPYLYETTVGAGLPLISTLRDLALSGDKIKRIEAVLSGTLSFIFNNFDGSKSFSALVRDAKAKGYTEPDPRDDLNAMDAARKVLILARECGLAGDALEFSSVEIEPILPAACLKAPDVEAFFKELEKSDGDFEARRSRAAEQGKALRYVAVIEEGSARLSIREEKADSPFRSLVDSDNIVVITTERYSSLPMVIKGPGAGAQVTAAGVFADIARIARTLV